MKGSGDSLDTGMISKDDLKDKYVFFDIDGTLAAYRFKDCVGESIVTNNGMNIQDLNDGIFFKRGPSKFMQKVVLDIKDVVREIICLSYCTSDRERIDKNLWLDKYYPMIKNRFIIDFDTDDKIETILKYCSDNNILLDKVVFVDDALKDLRKAEKLGIKSYHITSFLDYFME